MREFRRRRFSRTPATCGSKRGTECANVLRLKLKSKFGSCAICSGDNLTGFLDGMLDGETMRKADAHLRECESCRQEFRELEQTRHLLRQFKQTPETPGATFWADAYRKARLENSRPAPRQGFSLGMRRRFAALAMSATVAASLGLTFFISEPTGNRARYSDPAQAFDQVDVSSLISAHADYVAGKKLADTSNNRIIRSDLASSTAGDPALAPTDVSFLESVANGSSD